MTSDTATDAATTRTSAEPAVEPGATRGRPRSADTTEAILEATHDLLKEHGYDHLRMQDVADRAGSGLATIYRRWATKPELVAAAIEHGPLDVPSPTGDPEADLRAFVAAMIDSVGEDCEYMMSFMQAARENPEIGEVVRTTKLGPLREHLRSLMTAVVGSEPPSVEFLLDGVMGAVLIRTSLLGEQIDGAEYGDEIVRLLQAID